MNTFNIPQKSEVTENNQLIFNQLEKSVGFVPNLYATFAHSKNALATFLSIGNNKTSLSTKEKEVINLAVSQVNQCIYCLSAHTAIGKMNGFSDDQILEIRAGKASFDSKLDALAKFAKNIALNRGATDNEVLENLTSKGYTKESIADAIIQIGEITMTNYLHRTTNIAVDFPIAKVSDALTI